MRQTACAWRFLPAIIGGGTWEGAHARHRRREFITLLGGAAVAWPLAARAPQGGRVRRIGVLINLAADDPEGHARITAFAQGLQEADVTTGRNVRIDYHCGWRRVQTR